MIEDVILPLWSPLEVHWKQAAPLEIWQVEQKLRPTPPVSAGVDDPVNFGLMQKFGEST